MKPGQLPYNTRHIISTVFFLFTLSWLTVSTPFVYADQQVKKELSKQQNKQDNTNPFSNTTEEKNESGVNILSEFLHETDRHEQFSTQIVKDRKCQPSDLYFAFHPELISPPPEAC